MEKLKKFIVNLKVAGKLKAYRVTVLTMTVFLVAVALISTLVIRSNVKNITAVCPGNRIYTGAGDADHGVQS